MPDLIYSRKADNGFLTRDEIAVNAPAVFADSASDKLSSKYGNFNSASTIDILADYGYQVTQAAQVKSRIATNNIHGQHLLAFAHKDSGQNDEQQEIVFYNSHDGKSSMKLFAGMFRFICSNGMIIGEGSEESMRHYKSNLDNFEELLNLTINKLGNVDELTQQMKNITPNQEQVQKFANLALQTRYDSDEIAKEDRTRNSYNQRTISQILRPTRAADASNDAWTVFNRVQESILRGGMHVIGEKTREGYKFDGYKQSKAIASIKETVTINRKLWDIGQEVLAA